MVLSVLPLTVRDAPYQTTLTTLLQTIIPFIQFSCHIPHRFVRRLPRSVPSTPLVLITDPGHVSIHRADELSPDSMHTLLQRCTGSVQVLLSRLSMSIPNNHELHLARTAPVTIFCPGFYALDLHFVIKFYHHSEE
jgi:hypothetical protein